MMALSVGAQNAYMCAGQPKTAVFEPAGYDKNQHEPSPIFVEELKPGTQVPGTWTLRPSFGQKDGKCCATIPVGSDVDLYGTGEVTGPLRRNGRKISLWNVDTPAYSVDGGTHLYQSHPWVMGVRPDGTAFGLIADNTWKMTIETDSDVRFESEGPAFRVIAIEADTPQLLLQQLADLTGHMEMPPLWSLGYQQCRFSYNPDSRVKEIADTLRLHRIPSDVIWMDIDYMDSYKIFTFNPKEFPDPKGLNNYLHRKNFKSVYMIDPGVKVEEGYFVDDQGTERDYWVKDADGKPFVGNVWPGPCHFPDFTRPEVRQWWSGLYKDYMATGIDGVWNDMNEPSVFGGPDGTMPTTNKHLGGGGQPAATHLRYHNVYGLNMVRASREGLLKANPNKRPFILSRSNFLGGQRYAATWTGDNLASWDQFELSIPMSITLGLSGQPFSGPDIGGFCESSNGDLVAHWTAVGAYYPFMRNHSIKGARNQEPWAFDKKVLDACRTAIERRYRLMPYLYTLFREASLTGVPVMRPLFFADAKDPSLRAEDKAFMFGGDIIVVPIWTKDTPMPKGNWQRLKLETTSDDYQPTLWQREGSVVPMANLYQNTVEYRTDSLTLLVNPDAKGNACGKMYLDAGDGFEYQQGRQAWVHFKVKVKANGKDAKVKSFVEGDKGLAQLPKNYRLGIVRNGNITYTDWRKGLK